jgi:hypothetical protein
MATGRVIKGRRRDLTTVKAPETLERVGLVGPGIESLEGIERMTRLYELQLDKLKDPDLSLLGRTRIRLLQLQDVGGRVDYHVLAEMRHLENLSVLGADAANADAIAAVDFSRFPALRSLTLGADTRRPVQLHSPWKVTLVDLNLMGFTLTDADLERVLAAAAQMRSFGFTPTSHRQRELARAAFGEDGMSVHGKFGWHLAPDDTIFSDPGGQPPYSLVVDLAESWDLETNLDAEELLAERIEAADPDLAGRIRFDTESSAVRVVSMRREDLEFVRALIAGAGSR